MAKFRTNHSRNRRADSGGMVFKAGLFVLLIGGLFYVFNRFTGGTKNLSESIEKVENMLRNGSDANTPDPEIFLPTSTTGEIIRRSYFTLSYVEEHEQAEWVAYELTREKLAMPNVNRTGDFRPDPKVRKASASPKDYTGTGYDRGHLAPAGDMAFSTEAMSESFYMTNISPQIKNFNGGIWRELEELTRDWAREFDRLYVVTGPVLAQNIREKIGENNVSVPDEFYKVILDISSPDIKGIGFIMPNEISNKKVQDYAVTIDKVEEATGIDFFYQLFDDEPEEQIESSLDISLWKFNDKKYELRVRSWNTQK